MTPLENAISDLIRAEGPLTGAEIRDRLQGESLALWQTCRSSAALEMRTLGRRYLRLDQQVDGYARLSPSILREFLTYSVTGLSSDPESLEKRVREISSRIAEISRMKHALADGFIHDVRKQFAGDWPEDKVCILLAGDVVYGMAHKVPRPERSTGMLVRGSDLDLVVILADDVPDDLAKRLDETIYQSKYMALVTPSVREEIDYVVKNMTRVHEQLQFDTFKRKVACKILHEGVLLHGSRPMFDDIKSLLRQQGVVQQIEDLEKQAQRSRQERQTYLLQHCLDGKMTTEDRTLFYSAEESEEFE